MNSMSKGYYDSCKKEKREEKQCPTILKCGCPNSTTLPLIAPTDTIRTFTLSSLTLDTSCLCDPRIKIDFASNIVAPVLFTGSFSIQVFKQCRNQLTPVPVGAAWNFNLVALLESKTFSFFVCDSDSCENDCCTYTAVLRVTSAVTVGTLAINNATLSATATCGANQCHAKCY